VASNDEQRASVIDQRIDVLQSSGTLDDAIESLQTRIAEAAHRRSLPGNCWRVTLQVSRDWPEASQAIASALELDPQSLPALTTAASISEQAGDLEVAANYHRRLAEADRRSRGDHLMNVARLEAQLGRATEAMEAANQLILAAPGNTDNYEFFAQLCFRLGRRDEGLDALRKAVRINPNEPRLTLALGGALAEDLQTREAIELYWRAFEKTEEVEDMTSLMTKLTPLYEQLNQFDQLVERWNGIVAKRTNVAR
jgi:tetratricopeptide (TPR) repeat protein